MSRSDDPPSAGAGDGRRVDASEDVDPRLLAAVQEYTAAVEAGRRPDRREFLARHSDCAAELSEVLSGLAFVHSAVARMGGGEGGGGGPAVPSPSDDLAAGRPLGDFRLIREIGRGGMGVVYEAEQMSLGRRVALKILPMAAALDGRHLQRFRNEAQAAAALHHSNIVPVYAVGAERSVHYYAMQLIDGQSLAEVIAEMRGDPARPGRHDVTRSASVRATGAADEETVSWSEPTVLRAFQDADQRKKKAGAEAAATDRGSWLGGGGGGASRGGRSGGGLVGVASDTLSLDARAGLTDLRGRRRADFFRTVARLGQQAAEALEHAHQNGVVHRDVKPANLLLDHRGTLWVTDFGLAQVAHAGDVTQPGDVVGTFRYMSPEQASGRAVVLDQRTDVYSLGVTLYEFLTLHRAVPGETREELLRQILEVDPRPPRSIDRSVPPELETILGKAMAKGPDDRYQSAQEMADDLRRFLRDEPIRARRPGAWDRAVKWTRRHRALSLAAIAVLVVVAAAMTVTAALTAREQGKTRAAYERERQRAAEAERRGKQARDAVKFFTTFAAREMPLDPQFVALRRRMLEEGLAYYQTFLAERADDPAAAAELASAKAWTETALAELAAVDELGRQTLEVRLAADPDVQNELGMSADQRVAVTKAVAAASQVMRAGPPDFTNLTPEQVRAHLAAAAEAHRDALAKAVTAAQLERLHQISRQARGVAALSDPDVAPALALTSAQRTALHAAEAELRRPQPRRHARDGPGGPDGPDRPGEPPSFGPPDGTGGPGRESVPSREGGPGRGFDDRRRALLESLVAAFTPAQRSAYEKLIGRPYPNAFAFDDRPGFGGPPGRPGGPGRGRGVPGGSDGRPPAEFDRDGDAPGPLEPGDVD